MLHLHHGRSTTALVQALAAITTDPLPDPFAREVLAVPAKGVERWLSQQLSYVLGARDGDGVCANVGFPSPYTLIDEAVAAASPEHAAAVDVWAEGRMVWPLLEVVETCAPTEPWCRQLGVHLGLVDGVDKGRRWSVVRKLAGLFNAYGQSRPEMLCAWAAGRDERGDGNDVPADLTWQPTLWRRLRERLDTPAPAELLEATCATLRAQPELVDLPERLSVFGLTRLAPARLQVVAALAEHRDVHLWLNHPSPAMWQVVADAAPPSRRRADDTSTEALAHPLLRSLARDVRELQQLVRATAPAAVVHHHESPAPPPTLLGHLQADLAANRSHDDRPLLDPGDRSVQVHACHGRARQVEVLREVVLGLLERDRTLEPRDVLVMCPDIEAFAPLIAASFGSTGDDATSHPAARLRVRLADRALRQTNPLLALLSQLLELGAGRATATQVLDVAGSPPVRRRFGFDDEAVETLRAWALEAPVRWGFSGDHRARWSLTGLDDGTWRAGLDRILLGAAMESDDDWLGSASPLDVDSAEVDLAGRFAELVDRLDAAVEQLATPRTATAWAELLQQAVLDLAEPAPDSGWQLVQLQGELADLAADSDVLLTRGEIAQLLDGRLAGRPTRASFRTGSLTVCTLVPMRSVPHRVVCLLGLDDGAFPRQSLRDGDDLLLRDPWIGERDPRSEDRQLLLDAIGAAQEHLVVTYTGADERTGAEVPPAVPLGELLDALDTTARTADGSPVRDAITVRHPLQPFDPRCFDAGELISDGPLSFDPLGLAGARAVASERSAPQPFLPGPLPAAPPGDVQLADLVRMLEHPAKAFLRQRLGVSLAQWDEQPADALPVELDGLQSWAVGDRLLQLRLAGVPTEDCKELEVRRGALPPQHLGGRVLQKVGPIVDQILQASTAERAQDAETVDIDVTLDDGRHLLGTVPGVRGDVLLHVTYSNVAAKHRLRAWLHLLALTAAHPGSPWRAVVVGQGEKRVRRCMYEPLDPAAARSLLGQLVALHDAGLREPLPLPVKAAEDYAKRRIRGAAVDEVVDAVTRIWNGAFQRTGERDDPEHVLVHGEESVLGALLDHPPTAAETGPGWDGDEPSRFGRLALRVWRPLLAHETQALV